MNVKPSFIFPITWSTSNYVALCQGVYPIQSVLHVTQVPIGALAWHFFTKAVTIKPSSGAYALNCHLLNSTKSKSLHFSAVFWRTYVIRFIFSKPILCMVSALAKPPTPSSRKTGTWQPCVIQRSHRAVPEVCRLHTLVPDNFFFLYKKDWVFHTAQ